jgi:hypothetical protein
MKRILCLDFDGVIHSYKSGWKGPRNIPDNPVPGMLEFIADFIWKHCEHPESMDCFQNACGEHPEWELHIYSSRSKYWFAKLAMKNWMVKHGFDQRYFDVIKFPSKKPPATLTIDDRVICFNGKPPDFNDIINFKPWNKKTNEPR